MDLQALHDKLEIQELLARYARGVDDRDWVLYRSVFTDDAFIDYTSAGAIAGSRDEVAGFLEQAFTAIEWSQHYITNIEIDLDGDAAHVRAMFYNPMQLPGMDERQLLRRLLPPRPGAHARRVEERPPDRGEPLVPQPAVTSPSARCDLGALGRRGRARPDIRAAGHAGQQRSVRHAPYTEALRHDLGDLESRAPRVIEGGVDLDGLSFVHAMPPASYVT